jgi:hypothetical protein
MLVGSFALSDASSFARLQAAVTLAVKVRSSPFGLHGKCDFLRSPSLCFLRYLLLKSFPRRTAAECRPYHLLDFLCLFFASSRLCRYAPLFGFEDAEFAFNFEPLTVSADIPRQHGSRSKGLESLAKSTFREIRLAEDFKGPTL